MKINLLNRFKHPIFLKLLSVVVVTGILVNTLIIIFFKFTMRTCFMDAIRDNVTNYMEYLINDMGDPPDISRARKNRRNCVIGNTLRWSGCEIDYF